MHHARNPAPAMLLCGVAQLAVAAVALAAITAPSAPPIGQHSETPMQEFYVNPSAGNDDSGAGTKTSPWQSLAHARDTVRACRGSQAGACPRAKVVGSAAGRNI
jgi:hypothetical protein